MRSLLQPPTRPSTPSPSTATPRPATRCLLFATGTAAARGAPRIGLAHDPRLASFRVALTEVLLDLAHQVVKDGEGATKFVTVKVTGAETPRSRAQDRAVHRQFAAGEDGDRRRGPELGPRGHGRRQGWRGSRPRQAVHLVRRHPRRQGGRGGAVLSRGAWRRLHEAARRSTSPSMSASARRARPCGPAISPPSTSPSMPTTGPDRAMERRHASASSRRGLRAPR